MKPPLKARRGVTLIELAITIAIVGILAGVSGMFIKQTVDLWSYMTFRNDVVSLGRLALARMEREIRLIKDSNAITIAEAARLQFTDINNNVIEYRWDPATALLYRNTDVLVSQVQQLKFCYYQQDNNPVCTPGCACAVSAGNLSNIFRIRLEIVIKSGTQTKFLKTQIVPRNIRG
jgi:prepilin-type N-terminal cleavage/methylation domain-containing protein